MYVLRYLLLLALLLMANYWVVDAAQRKQKPKLSLSEKVQNLQDLSAKTQLLQFNGPRFREYVKKSPRNYSVILLFTALAATRDCPICVRIYEEFAIMAQSYQYASRYSSRLFFGYVDYDKDPTVFHIVGVDTAPVIMHFPVGSQPQQADSVTGFYWTYGAEAMAKFVEKRTGIHINIVRPFNIWVIVTVVTLVLLVGGFFYKRRHNLHFLYSKRIWGFVVFIFTLAMSSGQMFNHMRRPPFVSRNKKGRMIIISPTHDDQLGAESFAIMFLYAVFALSMIMLTESITQTNKLKAFTMALMGLSLIFMSFGLILSMLGKHVNRYPYSFLSIK